tara:strand:- start:1693 stop:1899 length:207 start_codon:yes stop_codon:yes gene_type:complete
MKRISGEYYLDFTTEQGCCLPKHRQLDNEIQELFAATLDNYLHKKGVQTNEVHLILSNGGIDIEEVED